jgi:hypothetical protein
MIASPRCRPPQPISQIFTGDVDYNVREAEGHRREDMPISAACDLAFEKRLSAPPIDTSISRSIHSYEAILVTIDQNLACLIGSMSDQPNGSSGLQAALIGLLGPDSPRGGRCRAQGTTRRQLESVPHFFDRDFEMGSRARVR